MSQPSGDAASSNPQHPFRSGFVAIVGQPNVGKSSLLNSFLGVKLAMTSPKAQTTRDALLGIHNAKNVQLIFIDTPGYLKPTDAFQTSMKRAILKALKEDSDVVLWVVEPKALKHDEEFASILREANKPVVVAVNKMDQSQTKKDVRLGEIKTSLPDVQAVHFVSAKGKEGTADLLAALIQTLPHSAPYYPVDQLTDRWERDFVVEIIREALFHRYEQEIPYATAPVLEEFREREGEKDFIQVTLYVETEGQKGILIGKNGQGIKNLSQASRKEIEAQILRPIFLDLKVKVKKNWRKDSSFVKKTMRNL